MKTFRQILLRTKGICTMSCPFIFDTAYSKTKLNDAACFNVNILHGCLEELLVILLAQRSRVIHGLHGAEELKILAIYMLE